MNLQEELLDLETLFTPESPLVHELDFDSAVERAVNNTADDEAFSAISRSFEAARSNGDFARIQQMAVVLGATACLHEHLQQFSSSIAEEYVGHDTHEHSSHSGYELGTSDKSKKKKKVWSWALWKFVEEA